MESLLVSLADAAATLAICERTLRELIQQRRVRAVRIGRQWRIPRDELERLVSWGTGK